MVRYEMLILYHCVFLHKISHVILVVIFVGFLGGL